MPGRPRGTWHCSRGFRCLVPFFLVGFSRVQGFGVFFAVGFSRVHGFGVFLVVFAAGFSGVQFFLFFAVGFSRVQEFGVFFCCRVF